MLAVDIEEPAMLAWATGGWSDRTAYEAAGASRGWSSESDWADFERQQTWAPGAALTELYMNLLEPVLAGLTSGRIVTQQRNRRHVRLVAGLTALQLIKRRRNLAAETHQARRV